MLGRHSGEPGDGQRRGAGRRGGQEADCAADCAASADQAKLKTSVEQNTSDITNIKKTLGDTSALLEKYKPAKAADDKGAADKPPPKKLFDCGVVWPGASCGIIIGPLSSNSKRGVTASVVNNQVRVSTDSSANVAAFAEAHAFITNRPWPKWIKQGPFVAVGSATNNGFSAGLGWAGWLG